MTTEQVTYIITHCDYEDCKATLESSTFPDRWLALDKLAYDHGWLTGWIDYCPKHRATIGK